MPLLGKKFVLHSPPGVIFSLSFQFSPKKAYCINSRNVKSSCYLLNSFLRIRRLPTLNILKVIRNERRRNLSRFLDENRHVESKMILKETKKPLSDLQTVVRRLKRDVPSYSDTCRPTPQRLLEILNLETKREGTSLEEVEKSNHDYVFLRCIQLTYWKNIDPKSPKN